MRFRIAFLMLSDDVLRQRILVLVDLVALRTAVLLSPRVLQHVSAQAG